MRIRKPRRGVLIFELLDLYIGDILSVAAIVFIHWHLLMIYGLVLKHAWTKGKRVKQASADIFLENASCLGILLTICGCLWTSLFIDQVSLG